MDNFFYNRMFNPQYVTPDYYNSMRQMQYNQQQDRKVYDAVKAVHDLCKAVQGMDESHQKLAFNLCLEEMAKEFGW